MNKVLYIQFILILNPYLQVEVQLKVEVSL
jgi:hypothetical protein